MKSAKSATRIPTTALIYPSQYEKLKPGDPIVLTAFVKGWTENPLEETFRIETAVPEVWNAAALHALILKILTSHNESSDAHARHTERRRANGCTENFYCWLDRGLTIPTPIGGERTIYRRQLFLMFDTDGRRYNVALPLFPNAAIADFLSDNTMVVDVTMRVCRGERRDPSLIPHGPAPRIVTGKGRA